jgi:hypothetical protein
MIRNADDFVALRWYYSTAKRSIKTILEHEAQGFPEQRFGEYEAAKHIESYYERSSVCREFLLDPDTQTWRPDFDK